MIIRPEEGKLYVLADGTIIVVMADAKHACGIKFNNSIEILLHVF